jgi:threonylcarbamoyladenosine tRNA methylthiotransferase MtaB
VPFLHVFPYSERPGTPAARMPSVPVGVRRERAARLREAGRGVMRGFMAGQVGRTVSLLTETAYGGHSEHFASVTLGAPAEPGRLMAARVVGVSDDALLAEAA